MQSKPDGQGLAFWIFVVVGAILAAVLLTTAPARAQAPAADAAAVRIGGKNFTEQRILSSTPSQHLRARAEPTSGLGRTASSKRAMLFRWSASADPRRASWSRPAG